MAQVAALLASLAKPSAPASNAQPSFGDDFAAVLAGLTPKTDAKDASPLAHAPQTAHPVEQTKPVAAKAKPRLPAAVTPAAADIKPELKLKAPNTKAEPNPAAPAKAAPESDDVQDIVAAVTAPQPIDSAKIAPAVRAFLDSDTSKASAAVDEDRAQPRPVEAPKVVSDTPKAVAPAVDTDKTQAEQVHDAKPVTPEALAEIVAVAKNASSSDTVKLKADAALKLPANVSVKVTSAPSSDVPKAQPKPDGAPRAQSDMANVPQNRSNDLADSQSGDARQQDAAPQRHGAPQADQAPVIAKAVPLPVTQPQAAVAIAQPAAPIAGTATPSGAAAAASAVVPQQPDQPTRLADLGTAIAVKAAGGAKSFEIRLDPAELGRVEVQLNVAHDGTADATITVHRPETLALLLHDSQNLERTLRDAGLDVSNSSLNFSLKGEGRQGDGGGASGALKRNLPDSVVARSEATNASIASLSLASPNARLDIRV